MMEATRKEIIVRRRYAVGAKQRASELCCPVDYDCSRTDLRHPKETKDQEYNGTTEPNSTRCDGGNCG
jgi:hypothetical protein